MQDLRRMRIFLLNCAFPLMAEPVQALRIVTRNLRRVPGGKLGAPKDEQTRHLKQIREETFFWKAGFHWSFEGIEHQNRLTSPANGRYPAACFDYFWTKGLGMPLSSVKLAEGSDHLPVVLENSL